MKELLHKTILVVGTSLATAVKDLSFIMGFHNQFHHLHITLINSSSSDPRPAGQMPHTDKLLPGPLRTWLGSQTAKVTLCLPSYKSTCVLLVLCSKAARVRFVPGKVLTEAMGKCWCSVPSGIQVGACVGSQALGTATLESFYAAKPAGAPNLAALSTSAL